MASSIERPRRLGDSISQKYPRGFRGETRPYLCPKCGRTYHVQRNRIGSFKGKKRHGCFICFPKGRHYQEKKTHDEHLDEQMKDWLEWSWANCMDDKWYRNTKTPAGGKRQSLSRGSLNPDQRAKDAYRRFRKVGSKEDWRIVNLPAMFLQWKKEIRAGKLKPENWRATHTGKPRSARVYIDRISALHEFNSMWDFMTDLNQFPPGYRGRRDPNSPFYCSLTRS